MPTRGRLADILTLGLYKENKVYSGKERTNIP